VKFCTATTNSGVARNFQRCASICSVPSVHSRSAVLLSRLRLIDKILAHPLGFTCRPITLRNHIPKKLCIFLTRCIPPLRHLYGYATDHEQNEKQATKLSCRLEMVICMAVAVSDELPCLQLVFRSYLVCSSLLCCSYMIIGF